MYEISSQLTLFGMRKQQSEWKERMMMEIKRQHQQSNINTTFDFQKQVDLSLQLCALG